MQSLKIHIQGKVYKTGMLYFLKQQAFDLNIKGSIFYYNDHSIGVVAEGEQSNMDEFIKCCRYGNSYSLVESFSVVQYPKQEYASFEVLDEIKP